MTLTKQQALEKIKELEAFIKQGESKVWKPEDGEKYYCIDEGRVVEVQGWNRNNVWHERRWEIGNCYRTKKEVQAAVTKQKALVRINRYIEENFGKWEPDWENKMQSKWFIYYDYSRAVSRFMYHHASDVQRATFIPYLEKESHAEQLIKDMEGDLRIVFGIK